jgi:O-antigen/teichoic acid export membrane protein
MSSNIVFPAFSEARRDTPDSLGQKYLRLQVVSDAMVVTAASAFAVAGNAIVRLLFDHRYAQAGQIFSCLAIGVLGMRYYVVEQLMNADGNFKMTTLLAIARLIALIVFAYVGFHIGALAGAAVGVGLSTFVGWPVSIWYRHKTIGFDWRVELPVIPFLAIGAGVGWLISAVIHLYK